MIVNDYFENWDDFALVDTCGPPEIQNAMMNQTVRPGEQAEFRCQVSNARAFQEQGSSMA